MGHTHTHTLSLSLSLSLLLISVSVHAAAAVCQVDEQLYAWANRRLTAQLAAIDPRIKGTDRGPTESLASRRAALARAAASLADECSGLAAGSAAASAAASEGSSAWAAQTESRRLAHKPPVKSLGGAHMD